MILRREQPGDRPEIFGVHAHAFARPDVSVAPEAVLVDELRAAGHVVEGLSIVAVRDGALVGHVVCSRAWIADTPVLGLGPLGVRPDRQRRGVGSALMHAVIAAADALDETAIVLLGDPGYYARFGFGPAGEHGVFPPQAEWTPFFQLRTLSRWGTGVAGPFRYAEPFARVGRIRTGGGGRGRTAGAGRRIGCRRGGDGRGSRWPQIRPLLPCRRPTASTA